MTTSNFTDAVSIMFEGCGWGSYLNDNLVGVWRALDRSRERVVTLAENRFRAAFLDDAERDSHLAKVRSAVGKAQGGYGVGPHCLLAASPSVGRRRAT